MEEILRVENLSVRYYAASGKRQTGIQNINFSLQEGEIYGIIGESGSGKSTLLLAILGLLEDKAEIKGKIFYRGKEIQNLSEKEKKKIRFEEIAVVFQNQLDRLNPSLTVEEQILEIIRKKFQKKEEKEKRLLELFQMLHLDVSLRKKYPHQLSGGMRQRVFIAMGLALKPKILLIDEPTTALDPELKQQILELFQKIYKEYGMTMLIVSHDLEVIEKLSQKMLVFLRGSLLERGNTTNILEEARHPYTAALLQSSPYLNEWKDLWGIVEEEERHSCPFYERCTQKVKECLQYIPNLKVEEEEGVACLKKGLETVLTAKNMSKNFQEGKKKIEAVKDCSLRIRHREIVVLLGKSGSGKTTLLGLLSGLLPKEEGELCYLGEVIEKNDLLSREHCIQIVEQDPFSSTNPFLSVEEVIAEPHRILYKKNLAFFRETVIKYLKKVGLESEEEFLKKKMNELSGGQRQKVAIARAISMQPKLLLADEITSMLDDSGKVNIMRLLKQLQYDIGFSMLFVTHDVILAKKIADYVYYMEKGEIVRKGSVRKVFCQTEERKYEYQ